MKRKILATALSAVMAASLFVGCGSGSNGSGSDSGSKDGVQEIRWMFWDDLEATSDKISLGYKETIERFNKDYEGKYHVTPVTTNLEEYYTKLNAEIQGGEAPDVFICSPGPQLSDYVIPDGSNPEDGLCLPLDEYLEKDGWKDTFRLEDDVFKQQTYDGKIYAIPLNTAAACCFYNTEMFEKAGITEVPTDFDGLLDACAKLKDAGYTPITISASTAWCLSMVAGYLCESEGVDLEKLADGSASWEDGKLEAACEKLIKLSKYFQESAAGDTNDVATANFYNEEAAILIQGSWAIGQINGENEDFGNNKCGVFQFPGVKKIIAKSDSLCVSKDTKSPEACVALLKYFTDETAQKYTAEEGGKMPVTKIEFDESKAPAELAYVKDVFDNAEGTFGFYNESMPTTETGSHFDDTMVSVFLGDLTPAEAAKDMEEYYEENCRNQE
ncbi:MAG: extracellular solute-binding protein [Pseudobutyrivibrio sp.]|nr:extracellular solute-binding protein [Pseudobutyrivibrio sp.]